MSQHVNTDFSVDVREAAPYQKSKMLQSIRPNITQGHPVQLCLQWIIMSEQAILLLTEKTHWTLLKRSRSLTVHPNTCKQNLKMGTACSGKCRLGKWNKQIIQIGNLGPMLALSILFITRPCVQRSFLLPLRCVLLQQRHFLLQQRYFCSGVFRSYALSFSQVDISLLFPLSLISSQKNK